MNKVSKITKIHKDDASRASALSKVKNGTFGSRHRSTDRAFERGRGGIIQKRPGYADQTYQGGAHHANSLEDLNSNVSRGSYVKDMYQQNF